MVAEAVRPGRTVTLYERPGDFPCPWGAHLRTVDYARVAWIVTWPGRERTAWGVIMGWF